jgi:hypothetical protein
VSARSYLVAEETLYFPTSSFVTDYYEEAITYVQDHIQALKRSYPKLMTAYGAKIDDDLEAQIFVLMFLPKRTDLGELQRNANQLWRKIFPACTVEIHEAEPIERLRDTTSSPHYDTLHTDDDVWAAYHPYMTAAGRTELR